MRAWTTATATAALAALVLGACGGTREEASPARAASAADDIAVRATLKDLLVDSIGLRCTQSTTARLRRELTGRDGEEGYDRCNELLFSDETVASVDVTSLRVSGARAHAIIRTRGGEMAVKGMDLHLRKVDHWRIDRVASVTLDRPAFMARLRETFDAQPGFSEDSLDCIDDALEGVADAKLAGAVYLAGDPRPVVVPTITCLLRVELVKQGYGSAGRCLARRARREFSRGRAGRQLARGSILSIRAPSIRRAMRRVERSCASRRA